MSIEPILAGIATRCTKLRTGVDVGFADSAVSERLRERFPAVWMTVNGDVLPFEGNQFDVAVLNGAKLAVPLVREIHRVLKPAGLLFFTVEELVRRGPGSTLSKIYNAFLKCGYDIVSVSRPGWWTFGRAGKTLTICARKKNWREHRPLKVIG